MDQIIFGVLLVACFIGVTAAIFVHGGNIPRSDKGDE